MTRPDSSSSSHDTSASPSNSRAHKAASRPSNAAASSASSRSAKRTAAPAATATVSPSRVPRITAATASVPTTGVGGSPTTPAAAPAVWALAAGARREFAPAKPMAQAATATTAQPTAAVVTSSPTKLTSTPVGWVTGKSNARARWPQTNNTTGEGVYGTDLGIMWFNGVNKTVQVAFGDTFSGPNMTGDWRSNVLLLQDMRDMNLSDGLTLQNTGYAYQFIPAARNKVFFIGSEVTNIPSSAVYVNGENYVNYFSVKSWDTPGRWTTNYSAMSKFVDGPNGGKLGVAELDGPLGRVVPVLDAVQGGRPELPAGGLRRAAGRSGSRRRDPVPLRLRHTVGPGRLGLPVAGSRRFRDGPEEVRVLGRQRRGWPTSPRWR